MFVRSWYLGKHLKDSCVMCAPHRQPSRWGVDIHEKKERGRERARERESARERVVCWELGHALSPASCPRSLVTVRVRGGVRHERGGLGTTQSIFFFLDANKRERLDLQLSVEDPRQTSGDADDRATKG